MSASAPDRRLGTHWSTDGSPIRLAHIALICIRGILPGQVIALDREGFSFREGFSSNKRKILRDHGRRPGRAGAGTRGCPLRAICGSGLTVRGPAEPLCRRSRLCCGSFRQGPAQISRFCAAQQSNAETAAAAPIGGSARFYRCWLPPPRLILTIDCRGRIAHSTVPPADIAHMRP